MPGVHIGDGAIIGTNSVVAKDIPPYCIAVGNPCRVIKKRFDDELIELLLQFKWWDKSIEEIESLMPILSCTDLEKVKKEIGARLWLLLKFHIINLSRIRELANYACNGCNNSANRKSGRLRREPTVADAKQTQPLIDECQILQIYSSPTNLFKSYNDENIEKKRFADKNNKTNKKGRLQMIWNAHAW